MEINKNESTKSLKSPFSIVMYVIASIVAIIGIASLVNTVYLFKSTVSQYVAQGYEAALVVKQLVPNQLLPGIFESVAVYGGIAFALIGIGIVNSKVSKCFFQSNNAEVCCKAVEESIPEESTVNAENIEIPEQTETPDNKEVSE